MKLFLLLPLRLLPNRKPPVRRPKNLLSSESSMHATCHVIPTTNIIASKLTADIKITFRCGKSSSSVKLKYFPLSTI